MSSATHGELTLASGRKVWLVSFKQWEVYAGLLEGLPTREMNDNTVQRALAAARQAFGDEPFLVAPVQTPIHVDRPYPFGEPTSLPRIGCVARFHSHQPARDPQMDCSVLTVVWFQEEYAFPLSEPAERALRGLDWETLAHDDYY